MLCMAIIIVLREVMPSIPHVARQIRKTCNCNPQVLIPDGRQVLQLLYLLKWVADR